MRNFCLLWVLVLAGCFDNGKYVENYESGELKLSGKTENNLKVGTWIAYNKSGKIVEKTYYRNDTLYLREVFGNDTISSSEELLGGLKHGLTKTFFVTGEIKTLTEYSLGKEVGRNLEYYKSGQIKSAFVYDPDGVSGSFKQFYPNGNLNVETDDFGNGEQKYYDVNGTLMLTLLIQNHQTIDTLFKEQDAIEVLMEDMKLLGLPE